MIRWIAAAGAGVVSLDSIINVAFPAMAAAFAEPPERVRWVIVCYVFTYSLTAFWGGALADRVGHARVFRVGVALTAIALAFGAVAPTFNLLLVARVVQGLGGGLVYGTAPGIVTLASPPEQRGRALGFLNAGIGVGFTIGPLVAGALVAQLGWRSTFSVRVPIALAVFAWSLVALRPARGASTRLVAARDVLRRAVLAPGALSFVANASIFSVWLLAPFYLVLVRGLDAYTAGLLFTLTPFGTAIAAPLAGAAADRLGPRRPMVVGLLLQAVGLFILSRADATTSAAVLAAALFAAGFGLGLFQVPNMALIMGAFGGAQQGVAGGFAFLARTLGVVTGVLVLAAFFAARRETVGLEPAFGEAFLAAAVAVGLAAVAAAVGRGAEGAHRIKRVLIALIALAAVSFIVAAAWMSAPAPDPVHLAERDIAAGRFRALCVFQGWGCDVPGIGTRNYKRCYPSAGPAEMSAWFGDVIGGDEDLRARRRAIQFAARYNTTLASALDRLGKRWCPAGEDWDALARSVEMALMRNDPVIPGSPYVDVSRDAAPGHYFRVETDYPAWVNATARSSVCESIARHGIRHRVRIAIGPRAEAPAPTNRFGCEAGKLVPYTPAP